MVKSIHYDVVPRPADGTFWRTPHYVLPWEVHHCTEIGFRKYNDPDTRYFKVKEALGAAGHGFIGWTAVRTTDHGTLRSITESGDTDLLLEYPYRGISAVGILRLECDSCNDRSMIVEAFRRNWFIKCSTVVGPSMPEASGIARDSPQQVVGARSTSEHGSPARSEVPHGQSAESSMVASSSDAPASRASDSAILRQVLLRQPAVSSTSASPSNASASRVSDSANEAVAKRLKIDDHPVVQVLRQEKLLLTQEVNDQRERIARLMVERDVARAESLRLQSAVDRLSGST